MVSPSDFVHLHVHSECSLLDGFGKIGEYLDRVEAVGQGALGMSDHGNVFGIYQLIQKAKARGITPVPGCEFYVAPQNPEGAKVQKPVFYGPNGQKAGEFDVSSNGAYTHQTIWAYNNEGLKNLFKLSSLSYDPERNYSKPRIDFELLAEHSEGLVVATGCPSSEISTRFLLGQDAKAYEYANRLKEVFGDRLFMEIMDHDMSINLERRLLPKQLEMARKMGIPLLATNDAHYTVQQDHVHHEEMLCSQSGARMSDATFDDGGPRFAFNGNQFYLKSAEEMERIFPEADFPGALSNTLLIAEMASDLHLGFDPSLKPKAIIPSEFPDDVAYFRHLINVGFKERYGQAPREIKAEAQKRIANEFEVIHSSDFIGYFLTVAEYLNWTRDSFSTLGDSGETLVLPVGVGRGSVGGSIIAYLLKISELDPIKHDLLFERFLSAGRGDTYQITYDDGTTETVIVSAKRKTDSGEKYIHQLQIGDAVELDEAALAAQQEAVADSLPAEEPETDDTIGEDEPPLEPEETALVADTVLEDPQLDPTPESAAAPKPTPAPIRFAVSGPPAPEELSDLSNIPF